MRYVSLLCGWMPALRVCKILQVSPVTAWRYDLYILKTELPEPNLVGLEAILIDEKHIGKAGFITLILNARSGELLYLAEGRGKEVLKGFFSRLSPEQKQIIVAVGMDRSGAYKAAVEQHLPQAEIVLDKFHLVSNYNEVIDHVRRRSYYEASRSRRSFIKGQGCNLFRNPENLSSTGRKELHVLLKANHDLNTVYLLKDCLKQVWIYTYRKCA